MMKKVFFLVLSAVVLIAAPAVAADIKIGFIDLQRALLESEAGKKAKIDLEALEKSKKAAIDDKVKAVSKLEEELGKQGSVLSADARKAKEEELERLQRDLQRHVSDARAELQKKETELTDAILKDISEVVDAYGVEEGYTMILRSEVILSARKELDLTDAILKRFNESKGKTKEEKKEEKKEKKGKK